MKPEYLDFLLITDLLNYSHHSRFDDRPYAEALRRFLQSRYDELIVSISDDEYNKFTLLLESQE
nr:MAG: hypothetical protein [Microvirus sp.]